MVKLCSKKDKIQNGKSNSIFVIPAKAGIQDIVVRLWITAFAGMTAVSVIFGNIGLCYTIFLYQIISLLDEKLENPQGHT
jgi:hypothetical protein